MSRHRGGRVFGLGRRSEWAAQAPSVFHWPAMLRQHQQTLRRGDAAAKADWSRCATLAESRCPRGRWEAAPRQHITAALWSLRFLERARVAGPPRLMATWTSCLGGVEARQAPRQAGVLNCLVVRRAPAANHGTSTCHPVTLSASCSAVASTSALHGHGWRLTRAMPAASLLCSVYALAPLAAAVHVPRRRLVAPAVRGSRRRRPCAPSLSAERCVQHVLARPTLPHLPLHAIYLIAVADEWNHAVSPALHQMSPVLLDA